MKIEFKNFKKFNDWQTIDFKDLTVLIGANNAGKSSITQLLMLIIENLKNKTILPVLELNTDNYNFGHFNSIIYSNAKKKEIYYTFKNKLSFFHKLETYILKFVFKSFEEVDKFDYYQTFLQCELHLFLFEENEPFIIIQNGNDYKISINIKYLYLFSIDDSSEMDKINEIKKNEIEEFKELINEKTIDLKNSNEEHYKKQIQNEINEIEKKIENTTNIIEENNKKIEKINSSKNKKYDDLNLISEHFTGYKSDEFKTEIFFSFDLLQSYDIVEDTNSKFEFSINSEEIEKLNNQSFDITKTVDFFNNLLNDIYNSNFVELKDYKFISSILNYRERFIRENEAPKYLKEILKFEVENKEKYQKFKEEYLEQLNKCFEEEFSDLKIKRQFESGYQIFLYHSSKEINLADLGDGLKNFVSILFPVIFNKHYNFSENRIIIIQEPEIRLHPKQQSYLADFFVEQMLQGNKFLIETHSEYFLRKLQIKIADKPDLKEKISINFLKDSKIEQVVFENDGTIKNKELLSSGFLDESAELIFGLLKKSLEV